MPRKVRLVDEAPQPTRRERSTVEAVPITDAAAAVGSVVPVRPRGRFGWVLRLDLRPEFEGTRFSGGNRVIYEKLAPVVAETLAEFGIESSAISVWPEDDSLWVFGEEPEPIVAVVAAASGLRHLLGPWGQPEPDKLKVVEARAESGWEVMQRSRRKA